MILQSYTCFPRGLNTREGVLYGAIIFTKFFVCITSVILLSSTTSMSELVASARRLGLPKEMPLLFTMMVRYLFVSGICLKDKNSAENPLF